MLYRPFVENIYGNLPFLGLVAALGVLIFARELRRKPPYSLWKLNAYAVLSACCMSPFCLVLLLTWVMLPWQPPVTPPPRCEIGWTLHIENGVVIKKIPVVICEELNGKWITAKQ